MTSRTCRLLSTDTTGPPSDRIVFQASVRIRKLVKNGAITRISTTPRQRPARNAMRYASGYPSARQSTVAAPAYSTERRNWGQYSASASQYVAKCQVTWKPSSREPVCTEVDAW